MASSADKDQKPSGSAVRKQSYKRKRTTLLGALGARKTVHSDESFRTKIARQTTKKTDDSSSFEFEYEEEEEEVEKKTPWWVTRDMAENIGREAVLVSTLRAFLLFILFLAAVITVAFNRRHGSRHNFYRALRDQFVEEEFKTYNDKSITYENIRSPEDFWMFTQTLLVEGWYWEYYYWIDPDDPDTPVSAVDSDDRKLLYENLVMGVPRIRQVKTRNDSCQIHEYFRTLFSGCYDKYLPTDEDKDSFGKMTGTAWTYNTAEQTKSLPFSGQISTYGGGGYYLDLSKDKNTTEELFQDLYDNLWIDKGTRAVFIDWTVYNANLNLYCLIKLVFEFPPTGGIIASDVFQPELLDVGFRSHDKASFVMEIIIYVMAAYYLFEELREMWFFGCEYFTQFWSYMDLGLIAMIIANFMTSVALFPNVSKIVDDIVANPNAYGNMEYIGWMKSLNNTLCASMMFLGFIKIFKYLNLNKTMGQLNITLKNCVGDIGCFTIMFIIIFFAYAQLGYLLFGTQAQDYRDIGTAMLSLLRCILGDFDYETIEKTNSFLAPVYFLSYIFLVFFVLLNMFLAIINDTYADVKTEIAISKSELLLTEYLQKYFQHCLRKCGFSKEDAKETQSLEVLAKIREAFEECGFNKREIEDFMTKYGNPDNDTKRMVKELEARANATAKIDDSVFVRLVDFIMNERLDKIRDKLDDLIGQFREPMARIEKLEKVMKGTDSNISSTSRSAARSLPP